MERTGVELHGFNSAHSANNIRAEASTLTSPNWDSPLEVGQSKCCHAVPSIERANQAEERSVLADGRICPAHNAQP